MIELNQATLEKTVQVQSNIISHQWIPIINGDECLVWLVDTDDKSFIVRVSPSWRTAEELTQSADALARKARGEG